MSNITKEFRSVQNTIASEQMYLMMRRLQMVLTFLNVTINIQLEGQVKLLCPDFSEISIELPIRRKTDGKIGLPA